MDDCLFCKIIAGDIPSEKIYEDATTYAFLDIKPLNKGHTLVIPKNHHKNIFDLPETEWLSVMKTVHMLASKIRHAVEAGGINISMNNEPVAHQIIFHAHVHIIPRFEGDPHTPWIGTEYKEGESKIVAEKIKSTL